MHSSLLIAVSLLTTPLRAYAIIPGLIASAQPSCTYVTIYYDNSAELASATSSFLSINSFCTMAGSVAPRAAAASTTPGPSLSPSIYNSFPTILSSSSNIPSTTSQSPATSTTMSYSCAVSNPTPPSAGRVQLAGISTSVCFFFYTVSDILPSRKDELMFFFARSFRFRMGVWDGCMSFFPSLPSSLSNLLLPARSLLLLLSSPLLFISKIDLFGLA